MNANRNFFEIHTPESLKNRTINRMEKELHKHRKPIYKIKCIPLAAVLIALLFTMTAFAYSLFSGLSGDELSLSTLYKGNGIVEITVENQSNKELKFTNTVKLEQWSTNREILRLTQEMPAINPSETKTITIDLSVYDISLLETPLVGTDWYYFVLTNNNFLHGYDWMASVTFAEPINTESANVTPIDTLPYEKPMEDNTSPNNINSIKTNYTIQKPLKEFSISFPYNDYQENGVYVHAELDLVAELGTDIYAICEGTVLVADFNDEMGLYMIIDHGNGLESKYAHCKELFKEQGDIVAVDDVIASVGKTGMATGEYLAFSVTLDGVPINPELLFE